MKRRNPAYILLSIVAIIYLAIMLSISFYRGSTNTIVQNKTTINYTIQKWTIYTGYFYPGTMKIDPAKQSAFFEEVRKNGREGAIAPKYVDIDDLTGSTYREAKHSGEKMIEGK